MYPLAYESIAAEKMSSSDMEGLLEQARSNNARDGITGCLILIRDVLSSYWKGTR